jgi:hypothetical protein
MPVALMGELFLRQACGFAASSNALADLFR